MHKAIKCSQCYRPLCSCRCSSTTKRIESVSLSDYVFLHALRYQAESCHGGTGRAHEVCGHIFEATPPGVDGHPGVNLPLKCPMPTIIPNLVKRTPDQSVVHWWGQRSWRLTWDQPGVELLRNALWPPNLVGRIPDQSVMHCWVKGYAGVSWGQVGVNLLSNQWPPNLVGRTPDQIEMYCWGQRSCRGHLGVNQGSNCLEMSYGHQH